MPDTAQFPREHSRRMIGTLLTRWTIRLALACLAVYFAGKLLGGSRPPELSPAPHSTHFRGGKFATLRWIWTAGCLLFLAHVACAFHFTHHWSHTHAWQHTADETQRLMGISYGDGIYFSYFFLLLWVADVVALWVCNSRPVWIILPIYLFIFFIALNGAIVFEDGPTRPVGAVVVLILAGLALGYVARSVRRFLSPEHKGTVAEVEA